TDRHPQPRIGCGLHGRQHPQQEYRQQAKHIFFMVCKSVSVSRCKHTNKNRRVCRSAVKTVVAVPVRTSAAAAEEDAPCHAERSGYTQIACQSILFPWASLFQFFHYLCKKYTALW
ncbi:MAG: hypothetical protein J1F42_15200, partial [Lachnospiraceae bacterium]|nr:hypothetical protein [Lachnospiraceae bacterium]